MTSGMSFFLHDKALCESDHVGEGTRIWAFAHVLAGARIGLSCNICDHVFIEGGTTIGDRVTVKNNALIFSGVILEDDVFVGPNAVFTNDRNPRAPEMQSSGWTMVGTVVRRGASIGANATIVCGATIGAHAMVGAGAVVVSDVAPYALVVGNPAGRRGWVCVCGSVLGSDLVCACGRKFREAGDTIEPCGSDRG